MSKYRYKMNKKKSKRLFTRTASKLHPKNMISSAPMRLGHRL